MNNGKRIPRVDEEDATGTQTSEAQTFSSALVSVCLSPLLLDASHGEECFHVWFVFSWHPHVHLYPESSAWQETERKFQAWRPFHGTAIN